jgi:hypothetical protein
LNKKSTQTNGGNADYISEATRARRDILNPCDPDFLYPGLYDDKNLSKIQLEAHATLGADFKLGPTTDPVLAYIQRQAETMGLGYIPVEMGGNSPEQIGELAREREQRKSTFAYSDPITIEHAAASN